MKRSSTKIRPRQARKYIVSILVISVIVLVLDLVFFALSIARSAYDLDHADQRSLYSVYWLGLPVLFTAIIGIIAGVRKQKALKSNFCECDIFDPLYLEFRLVYDSQNVKRQNTQVIGYMVLTIITCLLAASMAILFMLVVYIICGSFSESGRVGKDGKSCDFKEPNRAIYITIVADAVLIFICCLIGSICACTITCSCYQSLRARDEPEVVTLTPLSSKPTDDPFV